MSTGTYRILAGHLGPVQSLAFSPDGQTLASGDLDGAIQLWNVTTGTSRSVTVSNLNNNIQSVAFSPDGQTIASGGEDGSVQRWNPTTGQTRRLPGHAKSVAAVAFSPDGRTLASGSDDARVTLWDLPTGHPRTTFTGNTSIHSLAWSRDGRSLAWGAADKTVRLWNVLLPDPPGAIRKICHALHRDLTSGERALYLPNGPANAPCPPAIMKSKVLFRLRTPAVIRALKQGTVTRDGWKTILLHVQAQSIRHPDYDRVAATYIQEDGVPNPERDHVASTTLVGPAWQPYGPS
ncbi:WD40 repeat domain-containing protein [Streptomyces sp. NPDC059627]